MLLGDVLGPAHLAGLRFSDLDARNVILDMKSQSWGLIDLDRFRKIAEELLFEPTVWINRNEQQRQGASRLKGLVKEIVSAGPKAKRISGGAEKLHKKAWEKSKLQEELFKLGRDSGTSLAGLMSAVAHLLDIYNNGGWYR